MKHFLIDKEDCTSLSSCVALRACLVKERWSCGRVDPRQTGVVLTEVGSSRGSSMSAWRRKTFPRHTLHSIRSNMGILSLLITPATNLRTATAVRSVVLRVQISPHDGLLPDYPSPAVGLREGWIAGDYRFKFCCDGSNRSGDGGGGIGQTTGG